MPTKWNMDDNTGGLDAALDAFNAQVEAEQEAARHWTAFDLMSELAPRGVTYAEARAALEESQWSVTQARKRLEAAHA